MPARLAVWGEFMLVLEELAQEAITTALKKRRERTRQRRGGTLRPGWGTPLWNELAKHVAVELRRYGDKANLGRYLCLPRQRVHEMIVARNATPDAERVLMLLMWLQYRVREREAKRRVSRNT
jgi:hypothetical protein